MKFLYHKLKEFDLGEVYSYVMENNPSRALPYHNNFHLESVAKFTILGAEHHNLPTQDIIDLVYAALTHDFDHSGSGKDDDANIIRALHGFGTMALKINAGEFTRTQPLSPESCANIKKYIRCTRFPYLVDGSTLSIQEQIIRDADILQGLFAQDYIMGIVAGIAKEANIPMKNMLNGQEAFWKGTKFCTEWAVKLSQEKIPDVLFKANTVKEFY